MHESIESLKAEIRELKAERDSLKFDLGLSARDQHLNTIESNKTLALYLDRLDQFEACIKELQEELRK